jgi:hypothetical protein
LEHTFTITWAFSPETFREKASSLAASFRARKHYVVDDGITYIPDNLSEFCERGAQIALALGEYYACRATSLSTNVTFGERFFEQRVDSGLLPIESFLGSLLWGRLAQFFQSGFDLDPKSFVDDVVESYCRFFNSYTVSMPCGIFSDLDTSRFFSAQSKQQSESVKIFIKVQCDHTSNGLRWRHPDTKLGAKLPRAWIS